MKNKQGEKKMKTIKINKVICETTWDGYNFQFVINGKKYPKERGEWYKPSGNRPYDTAEAWAIGEFQGKFLSRGGNLYNSKEDYYKEQNELCNFDVRYLKENDGLVDTTLNGQATTSDWTNTKHNN